MKKLLAFAFALSTALAAAADRPPQFILFSFDRPSDVAMWEETRAFAKKVQGAGTTELKFTYFVNGVDFLEERLKTEYHPPRGEVGTSVIPFAASDVDVLARIAQVNQAKREGHEIASAANGRFDGSDWSEAEWSDELGQFSHLVCDAYSVNGLKAGPNDPARINLKPKDFAGFRAPKFAVSPGLNPALKKAGYRYDSSRTDTRSYWPKKDENGIWNFPLAMIPVDGFKDRFRSGDTEFYASKLSQNDMTNAYKNYFSHNYNGNRAPMHFAHHFTKWNDGAYWNGLKEFAALVCVMPEVRCVTESELADFLDEQSDETILKYEKGEFPPAPEIG